MTGRGGFWQAVSYGNEWGMERETAGLVGEGLSQEACTEFRLVVLYML